MSQENVELTVAHFRRSATGISTPSLHCSMTTWRPSRFSPGWRGATTATTASAVGGRPCSAPSPTFDAEIVEVHDLGDMTIATLRLRGHGAESDTPLDAAAWQITEFRQGRCVRWSVYMSKAEALAAAGLSE